MDVLRNLIQMLLVTASRLQPPKQLILSLYALHKAGCFSLIRLLRCSALLEKTLPPRLRVLCEVLLKGFAEDEPEALKSRLILLQPLKNFNNDLTISIEIACLIDSFCRSCIP